MYSEVYICIQTVQYVSYSEHSRHTGIAGLIIMKSALKLVCGEAESIEKGLVQTMNICWHVTLEAYAL